MLSFSYNKLAWISSLFIHIFLFIALASAGFFTINHVKPNPDTSIYIVDNNSAHLPASGGSDNGRHNAANDITLPEKQSITSSVPHQSSPPLTSAPFSKKSAHYSDNNSGNNTSNSGQNAITASGTHPEGYGTGSDNGMGSHTGSGFGSGQGHGTGNHAGNSSDAGRLHVTVPPHPTNSPTPVYPDSMRSSGLEGTTSLAMLISASGHVENVTITGSSGQTAFDNAAIQAAYKYKFIPARNSHNQNVRCRITKSFTFHLNN